MVDKNQNENTVAMSIEDWKKQFVEKQITFSKQEQDLPKSDPIFLWESMIQKPDQIISDNASVHRRLFFTWFFILVISILWIVWVWLYTKYLKLSAKPTVDIKYESYINKYKNSQNIIDDYIKFSDYTDYSSIDFLWNDAEKNITNTINAKRLSYVQKKDIIQSAINTISQDTLLKYDGIANIKKDITKYWFFPKEIFNLLDNQEYITSIKKSLLALETVKFGSAIRVFSFLPSFIKEVSESLWMTEQDVKANIQQLSDRWEKDIAIYLNNCYLNPYEIDYDCKLIGDFDKYYNIIQKEKNGINLSFFKKLIFYIDAKLEQTNMPNFLIVFNNFDSKSKRINFNVHINTSSYDEETMILNEGISNPHIFIFTNLLNLLKQSIFVVSDSISIKQLAINEQNVDESWRTVKYHSSSTSFSLPIQKSVEREITDFVDENKFILSE